MADAEFHLLPEPGKTGVPEPLSIPAGVSSWDFSSGEPVAATADSPGIALEPVVFEKHPRLLVSQAGEGPPIQRNDQVVCGIQLLSPGDQIRFHSGPAFEVARFHSPRIGPPLPHQVGSQCPVCLTEIGESDRVFTCPVCESVFHLNEKADDGDSPLECALAIADCPRCQTPICLDAGYQPEPEFLKR